ncbi:hypothetical protein K9M79_07960 [Candidatus Woesearchaeota archaeon]|nr:hypothetical protein [Candidatus Woesearchaeota archaeon]
MSNVETIVTAIITVIATGIIIFAGIVQYSHIMDMKYENKRNDQMYDVIDTTFSSLMLIQEPMSEMQVSTLLGAYFFQRDDNIKTPNGIVSVKEALSMILDFFFGEDKYYLEAYPVITDIKLYFIIDGSITMDPARANLASQLSTFIETLEDTYTYDVYVKTYILSDDTSLCVPFTSADPPLECETLNYDALYSTRGDLPSFYDAAQFTTIGKSFIAESDWATGTAIVSHLNPDYSPSKLKFFIPITDEVALGTKEEDCYYLPYATMDDYYYSGFCLECTKKTDYTNSDYAVQRAITILQDHMHIVCPMNTFSADYDAGPDPIDEAAKNYINQKWGGSPFQACGNSHCDGCTGCSGCPTCTDGCTGTGYYWHPEGYEQLKTQLQNMADETGGQSFTLIDFNDIYGFIQAELEDVIAQLQIKVGSEQPGRYFGYNKVIPHPMANDAYMDIRLKYYSDKPYLVKTLRYVVDEDICQDAENDLLCDGLKIAYFTGYKERCCKKFNYCC